MSSHDDLGITEDDKRLCRTLLDARTNHGQQDAPLSDADRPSVGEVVPEGRGNTNDRVHLVDPENPVRPWCERAQNREYGGCEFRERDVGMARVWREACSMCFPEGLDDE